MFRNLVAGLGALVMAPSLALAEAPADRVIWNGTIYTADAQQRVVEAVATRADRIVYVGDRAGAEKLVGAGTEVIDLAGRMALPGLHDTHIHPIYALSRRTCELDERNRFTLEPLVNALKACVRALGDAAPAAGEWITVSQFDGYGADSPAYLGRYTSIREGLNAVSDRHIVFLTGKDFHVFAANDYALAHGATLNGKQIAVNAETLSGELADYAEYFEVDGAGNPTGIIKDAGAYDLFEEELETVETLVARKSAFNHYFHKAGITSAQDPWVESLELEAYSKMGLDVRLTLALFLDSTKHLDGSGGVHVEKLLQDVSAQRESVARLPRLKADTVKFMVDGVIENPSQTAALKRHYLHAEWDEDGAIRYDVDRSACPDALSPCEGKGLNYGILEFDPAELARAVTALDRAGFTVHFHALGDRAVTVALDAVEAARKSNPDSTLPHNIAHFQQVDPADFGRFGPLGVFVTPTLSWQSPAVEYDRTVIPYIDEHRNVSDLDDLYRQDTTYMRRLYPVRSIMAGGAIVAAGSDAPVEGPLPRPFSDIMYGLIRGGWIEDADGEQYWAALNRDERMRIEDLIDAYTINGARALRQDHLTGSLEVGKKADLVIINQDIIAAAHTLGKNGPEKDFTPEAYGICDHWWAEFCRTRVEQTYFDGRRVWPPQD